MAVSTTATALEREARTLTIATWPVAKPSALAGDECARVEQANAKPPTKAGASGQAEAFSAREGQGDEQEEADEAKKLVVTR
jgi:hypothetical protein